MSQEVLMRGLFSGLMALAFAWVVFSRYDDEIGTKVSDTNRQKYLPYIPGSLLPGFLLGITVLAWIYYGYAGAARMMLSSVFAIFLHSSLYYGECHGIFGNAYHPNEATFEFSYDLAAPFTVVVESWDHSSSYTVSQTEMTDGFTMTLPDYPAHYTISACFYDQNGNLYEAEFWFDAGEIPNE